MTYCFLILILVITIIAVAVVTAILSSTFLIVTVSSVGSPMCFE